MQKDEFDKMFSEVFAETVKNAKGLGYNYDYTMDVFILQNDLWKKCGEEQGLQELRPIAEVSCSSFFLGVAKGGMLATAAIEKEFL